MHIVFDDSTVGHEPAGWTSAVTGEGQPKWRVLRDDATPSKPNVLAQVGEGKYPVCFLPSAIAEDGSIFVKFKPVSGTRDQAGGLIWRVKDKDNYYVARANALEDNVTIYHTLAGRRVAFKSVVRNVASGVWHSLRVDFRGAHFVVSYDDERVLEAEDAAISGAGAVGVWTKADSVTYFDRFEFSPAP